MQRVAGALAMLVWGAAVAVAQPVCPGAATLTVFVANLGPDPSVALTLDGELVAPARTCEGTGSILYATTLECAGDGLVRCGVITGLRPGAWTHRLRTQVTGSAEQRQAQRTVLLAGTEAGTSNTLRWTIYPRTFVVDDTDPSALWATIVQASAFTASGLDPALITFSPTVFPGADDPRRIQLVARPCILDDDRNRCRPGGVEDGATAGLCLTGDRLVIDALDTTARPGGVILSVDTCGRETIRLYGANNILRGLVVEGSRKPDPVAPCQVDTVAVTGAAARDNRLEESVVLGPTCGDAVSVQNGARDMVIVRSRLTGARDKGLKVSAGGSASIVESCLHDNMNGGIQSTFGGHVRALRNVVQRNVPGAAQNGLSVSGTSAARSTLETEGNIVRFSGGRGLSVTGSADGVFVSDYVADNQFAGAKVEPDPDAPTTAIPHGRFRGVAFICNRHEDLTGTCDPSPPDVSLPCATAADCCTSVEDVIDPMCLEATTCAPGSFPNGFGAVVADAAGLPAPIVDFGNELSPGRNAFSVNRNTAGGANLRVNGMFGMLSAHGNQWEHCGTGNRCDVDAVLAEDIMASAGTIVELGAPPGPRAELVALLEVRPSRPQAGDIVRVFGEGFNAIDGNPLPVGGAPNCQELLACDANGTCPSGPCVNGQCPCAIESPAVQQANLATGANRIRIKSKTGEVLGVVYPDAVTPTMLAFRMPFDCFAPLVLEVGKRDPDGVRRLVTMPLCDPAGCGDAPAGAPCDDGNACTTSDICDGAGTCLGGPPVACAGPCLTCDPTRGCVPAAETTPCDDGNACTTAGHCRGDANICVPGAAVTCGGQCLTGACDPATGCIPAPAGRPCDDGDACTVGETCQGDADVCVPGSLLACDGACLDGTCDPATGCVPLPAGTICRREVNTCDVAERCDGAGATCPDDGAAAPEIPCDDGNACTVNDHCGGTTATCVAGEPRRCDGRCESGACDPESGCLPVEGIRAITCRADECTRPRIGRRIRRLAAKIDRRLDRGLRPRKRHVRRLARRLRRCGVDLPDDSG